MERRASSPATSIPRAASHLISRVRCVERQCVALRASEVAGGTRGAPLAALRSQQRERRVEFRLGIVKVRAEAQVVAALAIVPE